MRSSIGRAGCFSSCLCLLVACGGGSTPQVASAPAASSGQEAAAAPDEKPEPASPPPAPEAMPERAGPAQITVEAKVHGKTVPAKVRLRGGDGSEAASGTSGQALRVQSGDYEMQVAISDAAELLDRPTQTRPLTLHAGDDLHESVEFPWAMIQLNVLVNGNPDSGASVKLMRGGSDVAVLKSGAAPAAISPGRYEAEVTTHGTKIKVEGLLFPEGATQSVPVRVKL